MARMGRPPFPLSQRRTQKVLLALTRSELAAIRRAAGEQPVAVWTRQAALRAARSRVAR